MKDKYRILVVNQDEAVSEAIGEIQSMGEYTLELIHSATEALEIVKRDKYHIVFIDLDIPGENGIDLLKEMKAYDSLAQFIMTTNHSTMDKILSSLEYGAYDYLVNPFINSKEVVLTINHTIEKLERWRKSILDLVR